MNAAERLGFAVQFSRLKLVALDAGGLRRLQEQISGFLSADGTLGDLGGIIPAPLVRPLTGEYNVKNLQALQRDVRYVLSCAAPGRADESSPGKHPITISARWAVISGRLMTPTADWIIPNVSGTVRDLFLLVLFLLLGRFGARFLRRCEECGTVFSRVRRQIYCSRPCANRAGVRAYRQRQKEKPSRKGRRRLSVGKRAERKSGRAPVLRGGRRR